MSARRNLLVPALKAAPIAITSAAQASSKNASAPLKSQTTSITNTIGDLVAQDCTKSMRNVLGSDPIQGSVSILAKMSAKTIGTEKVYTTSKGELFEKEDLTDEEHDDDHSEGSSIVEEDGTVYPDINRRITRQQIHGVISLTLA